MKKNIFLLLLVFITFVCVKAQEQTTEEHVATINQEKPITNFGSHLSLSATLKNRHLWRCGQGINGFSIQSTLSYNLPFLSVGAWGAYEVDSRSYGEVDIFVEAYFLDYFTFGLYDFYYPDEEGGRSMKDFSNLESPNHVIDAFLSYSGTENIPLGGLVAAYVYGGSDQDEKGNQKYSTYLEVNYTFTLTKKSNLFLYLGATTSNESAYAAKRTKIIAGQEVSGIPVTNSDFNILGFGTKYTKNFMIGQFDAKVLGEFLYNTNADAVYMSLGTSISF